MKNFIINICFMFILIGCAEGYEVHTDKVLVNPPTTIILETPKTGYNWIVLEPMYADFAAWEAVYNEPVSPHCESYVRNTNFIFMTLAEIQEKYGHLVLGVASPGDGPIAVPNDIDRDILKQVVSHEILHKAELCEYGVLSHNDPNIWVCEGSVEYIAAQLMEIPFNSAYPCDSENRRYYAVR
jgi:hypothetical protein